MQGADNQLVKKRQRRLLSYFLDSMKEINQKFDSCDGLSAQRDPTDLGGAGINPEVPPSESVKLDLSRKLESENGEELVDNKKDGKPQNQVKIEKEKFE